MAGGHDGFSVIIDGIDHEPVAGVGLQAFDGVGGPVGRAVVIVRCLVYAGSNR